MNIRLRNASSSPVQKRHIGLFVVINSGVLVKVSGRRNFTATSVVDLLQPIKIFRHL